MENQSDLEQLANKLKPEEIYCLTAYLTLGNQSMAYKLAKASDSTADTLAAAASRWFKSPKVQAWLKLKESERAAARQYNNPNESDHVSREELLTSLSAQFRKTNDPKIKAEIGMKIADLNKYKQVSSDEAKLEYYIPMKCTVCPLYKEARAKIDQENAESEE